MNNSGGVVTWNLDVDDARFNTGIAAAETKALAFSKNLNGISFKNFASNAASAFGGVADNIQNLATKLALVGTASSIGLGAFIKSAADLQQTSASFRVLTGDAQVAQKLFADIAKFAATTPFEFPELAKSAQTILGFGRTATQTFGDLKVLGDISAATGANLTSLATVFGQVNATGKLMGQDALQLINNNIPITTILAKRLGVNVQEVKKRMEDGAISADLFNEALVAVTKEGGFAFKGTDQLAKTFNGRLSTLKDTALEAGRNLVGVRIDPALGLVVQPGGLFDTLSKALPTLTSQVAELGPKLAGGFQFLLDHGDTVKGIIAGITAGFVAARLAAIGFAIAAAINPFTLVAAAIIGFIGMLAYLEVKYHAISDGYNNFLKPSIDALREQIDIIGARLAPLGALFQQVADKMGIKAGKADVLRLAIAGLFGPLSSAIDFVTRLAKAFDIVIRAVTDTVNILMGKKGAFSQAGHDLMAAFGAGIQAAAPGVYGAAKSALSLISKLLPHSDADEGPLSSLTASGRAFSETFARGIGLSANSITTAANQALSGLAEFTAPSTGTGTLALATTDVGASTSAGVGGSQVIQNNNIYNQVDLDRVSRDLAYRVRR